ncbi:MAG: hypothetical protein K1X65_17110 [Caldilineales bacterium]|nr:hypothetical protein [Caldilineales bacterium]MCW5858323.1 hypothetical protein [Caldilineales bacterium]
MHAPPTTHTDMTDRDDPFPFRHLKPSQVRQIDNMLEEIGDFGELRLIIEKGCLKYVEVVKSRKL